MWYPGISIRSLSVRHKKSGLHSGFDPRKKGQELEGVASDFLVGNGLSGILVDDSWLEVILPWFPVTFLVMLIRTVSRWLHETERGTWKMEFKEVEKKKIDFRKCSCFCY